MLKLINLYNTVREFKKDHTKVNFKYEIKISNKSIDTKLKFLLKFNKMQAITV